MFSLYHLSFNSYPHSINYISTSSSNNKSYSVIPQQTLNQSTLLRTSSFLVTCNLFTSTISLILSSNFFSFFVIFLFFYFSFLSSMTISSSSLDLLFVLDWIPLLDAWLFYTHQHLSIICSGFGELRGKHLCLLTGLSSRSRVESHRIRHLTGQGRHL